MANLLKKHYIELVFLISLFYISIIYLFNSTFAILSLRYAIINFLKVLPFIALAQIIIFLLNKYLKNLKKLVSEEKKNWIIYGVAGILSAGAIYLWYEILSELRKKGLRYEYIALFLYERAIKIPLLPLQIALLGWKLTLLINLAIFFFGYIYAYIIKLII